MYYIVQGFLKKIKEENKEVKVEKEINEEAKPKLLDIQIPNSKSVQSKKTDDTSISPPELVLLHIAMDYSAIQTDNLVLSPPQDTNIEITDKINPKCLWNKQCIELTIHSIATYVPYYQQQQETTHHNRCTTTPWNTRILTYLTWLIIKQRSMNWTCLQSWVKINKDSKKKSL